ncbi:PAS domain-containing protein [Ferrovibrio terrae]|nr:PAS domain-containing protein [Ferrovibrio terrae]
MIGRTPFSDEPILDAVAVYWSRKRLGRRMADRGEIDPLDLPPAIWPNLLITEPAGASIWRYRLVGSAHVERYGTDFTGKTLHDIMQGSYRDYMTHIYDAAFHDGVPVYSESVFRWDAEGFAMTRRLMLPLSYGETDRPAQVFSVQVWPSAIPVQPRSITELSRSGGFRDGFYLRLDTETFTPLPDQDMPGGF